MKKIFDFICEAGLLKRVRRSGWWVAGIDSPESVADHSFRCAVIGYCLAKMEKIQPYQVLLMCLFGDIHEARINDLHKMAQAYLDADAAEDKAYQSQLAGLPASIKKELADLRKLYRGQTAKSAVIARDADILECLIQGKEYQSHGFKDAAKLLKKGPLHLKTKSAKQLWKIAQSQDPNTWWENIGEFKR